MIELLLRLIATSFGPPGEAYGMVSISVSFVLGLPVSRTQRVSSGVTKRASAQISESALLFLGKSPRKRDESREHKDLLTPETCSFLGKNPKKRDESIEHKDPLTPEICSFSGKHPKKRDKSSQRRFTQFVP